MQQALFRIPLKADWLPFGLPLWGVLLVLFLGVAAALYGGARLAPRWRLDPKSVQGAAVWVALAGLIVGGLAYLFADSGLPIYGFGMMLFLAFVVCNWVGGRWAVSMGVPKETIQDLAIWVIVGGLIGARLTSFLSTSRSAGSLWEFLVQFVSIWDGGIVLYGAVIGGLVSYVVAYFLVFRKQGVSTLKLADILAPCLAIGLCLGRIGCFLNGCCYGQIACANSPAIGVSFPLSAPPRYDLVNKGYQTAAGFTLAEEKKGDVGVTVDRVEPGSPAAEVKDANGNNVGLKAGDEILGVDGYALSDHSPYLVPPGAERSGDGPRLNPPPFKGLDPAGNLGQYLGNFGPWPRGKNDLTLLVRTGAAAPRTITYHPWTLRLLPTQLYETISMFLLFWVLTFYYPFRRHDGEIMALLMIGYSVHRYVNELLRADERPVGFESWTSVILFVAGVALWVWLARRPAQYRYQPAAAAPAASEAVPSGGPSVISSASSPTTATSAGRPGPRRNGR